MEEIIKAFILGVIQGFTEYLPISSTAHLRIIPSFFGWKDIGAAYTAVIQVGTMIAILIYFWKDLNSMLSSFIKSLKEKDYNKPDTHLFFLVLIGTIPILIFGYLLKELIRNEFRNMYIITSTIILFSFVMYFTERFAKQRLSIYQIKITDAIFIGIFQSLALIPGVSRSGATIVGGFLRNMERSAAARFSFLLSIPAILISGLFELFSEWAILFSTHSDVISLIIATLVSAIIGYASIWFLLAFLKSHTLMLFIVYRLLFGILLFLLLNFKIITN